MNKLSATLPGLLALGACLGPLSEPSIDPPEEVVNFDEHDHVETAPGTARRTLVRQPDGQIVEVEVEIRNGLAIMEGDIVIGTEDELVEPGHGIPRSNILTDADDLWPSHIIPYEFHSSMDTAGRANVMWAITQWQTQTSFRFVPRDGETDYLEFTGDGDGCYSWIGRVGFGQNVNLENGNCNRGNAMHEIGHALGLYHEQSRSDRNSFIDYYADNVEFGAGGNWSVEGTKHGGFDWGSMMLYSSFSFTKNNGPTMVAKDRWSMRPSGNAAWSDFRTNEWEPLREVRFGDFDGDGRTDALKTDGGIAYLAKNTTGAWTYWANLGVGTTYVGVGQFDADPRADLFRADYTGWSYSSAGKEPWVKINDSTYTLTFLMLGDFNGDGRTDVLRPDGTRWNWSRSGRDPWATLNTSGYTYGQIAVGDFDAAAGDDVLITTGTEWKYSSGGSNPAIKINDSTVMAKDMILGKFNPGALTDIVHPGAIDRYDISADGRSQWATFVSAANQPDTPSAGYVKVVDANSDGVDDILSQGVFVGQRSNLSAGDIAAIHNLYFGTWQVSRGGTSTFQYLNQTNIPMADVRFADFNNDGIDDVFRADGATWWVSYSGTGSWTYLNSSSYKVGELALGDFDNDGRADVFRTDGSKWWISKDGKGQWVQRNSSYSVLSQMKFGDLDGDGATDVFVATGTQWQYSKRGSGGWINLAASGVTNVALANMDGDASDDVVYATGTQLQYAKGGTPGWHALVATTYPLSSLKFGDFNNNKRMDVLRTDGTKWYVSWDGLSTWDDINTSGYQLPSLRIGHFDNDGRADIVALISRIAQ